MKIAPTSLFQRLSTGANVVLTWTVMVKKTSSLSEALSAGSWVDITDRVVNIPDLGSTIEVAVGQFTSDSIALEVSGVQWLMANVFDTADRVECKVMLALSLGSAQTADLLYMASGFIDRTLQPTLNELGDTAVFTVYTAQDLGSRMAGENVSTQYVESDIKGDASDTAGLSLQNIGGLYLTDAGTAPACKVGQHEVNYDYNAGAPQANLDGGDWVALAASDSTYTLYNADSTESCKVYVRTRLSIDGLPASTAVEKFVVVAKGDTLPRQWYRYAGARYLLQGIFAQLGITDSSFDELVADTAPYPATPPSKISFIDFPPNDPAVYGKKWAVTNDGTDLYFAVGHKVYKRTMATEAYSLVATLSAGDRVSKLMASAAHDHLWIFYGNKADDFGQNLQGTGKVRRLVLSTSTLSAEVVLDSVTGFTGPNAIDIIDAEEVYGLVFCDRVAPNGKFRFVDGETLSAAGDIFTGDSTHRVVSRFLTVDGANVYFKATTATGQTDMLYKFHAIGGGWVNDGVVASPLDLYTVAALNVAEGRIYYYVSINGDVKSHLLTSSTASFNTNGLGVSIFVDHMHYFGGVVYVTAWLRDLFSADPTRDMYLYGFSGNVMLNPFDDFLDRGAHAGYANTLTDLGGVLYGWDIFGRTFQYHDTVRFYVGSAEGSGATVTDMLNKVLQAFNLVGNVSSTKRAFVYRRGDADGTPHTTGNTLFVTVDEASDITRQVKAYPKAQLVSVTGDDQVLVSWNGADWDERVLSTDRSVDLLNGFIPKEIARDIAYMVYNFFSVDRDLYTVKVSTAQFQFEPFDNANLTFTTTKVVAAVSGNSHPIYSVKYAPTGSMEVTVLV